MRERIPPGRVRHRTILRAAAAAGAAALLFFACTPPDFTPVPTGEPLTIAPLQPQITAGMSFPFAAAGGTSPYAYSVSGNGSINSSTGLYTAAQVPGSATVTVTDHENKTASTVVTVHPSALWVIPTGVTIPANTAITFYGHGGTPPYTYSIVAGGVGSIDPETGVYSSASGGAVQIKVTDAVSEYVTTNVTVNPPADPLTISPSSAILETNVDVQFSASGGSGTGYTFSVAAGGKGSVTPDGLYSSGGTAGSSTVSVKDSLNNTADAVVTVNAPPPPLAITPTSATVVPGRTQVFTASGGSSPYSFTLTGLGSLSGSGSSRTYAAPGSSGFATIIVTDSRSRTASAPITITSALGITPSSTSVIVNGTVSLVAGGGSGTYAHWDVTGAGGSVSGSGASVVYTAPGVTGIATVTVTDSASSTADCIISVTPGALTINPSSITIQVGTAIDFDANGGTSYTFSVSSGVGSIDAGTGEYTSNEDGTAIVRVTDDYDRTTDASVTVNPPPLALWPPSATIQAGGDIMFTAEGGTPPHTYSIVSGVGSIGSTTGIYTSSVVGAATVKVTDHNSQTDTANVTVDPPPGPPLNLSPVEINVEAGKSQPFTATGGTPPYSWSATGGAIVDGLYTAPASVPSPTDYTIQVRDNLLQTRDATVTVYAPLAFVSPPEEIPAGTSFDFDASGGIPPYVFSMVSGLGAMAAGTGVYTAPGTTSTDKVRVTDSQGLFTDWRFPVSDPATWDAAPIDESDAGRFASLALDPLAPDAGNPQVAYLATSANVLKLAGSTDGVAWSSRIVDATAATEKRPSLAVDASGNARVAWYEAGGSLRYRAGNGAGWESMQIVVPSNVGPSVSLALDSSGSPHIAYYDAANGDLMYVKWTGSAWTTPAAVDAASDVGQYASLALDGSDHPHIAYYDATNGDLMYVKWTGSAWTTPVTVDAAGDVGSYASLALDGSDHPHIACYDATNGDLRYAKWTGSAWTDPVVVDSAGNVGQYASLALDPVDHHPHLAYFDASTADLKYAVWNGSTWVTITIDSTANRGKYASLAVDPVTRRMKIAYFKESGQDLLYRVEQ